MSNARKTGRKSNIAKAVILLVIMAVLCFAAACGVTANQPASSDNTAKTGKDLSLSRVLGNGQLIVGLDVNYPPIGFMDENGQIVGFDIDVAREACFRMGIDLVPKPIDWTEKDELLSSGVIDCIWNGMSVSPERVESMTLSEPYMKNQLIFMVASDSEVRTFLDLQDKRIGVQTGTTAEDEMEASEKFAEATIVTCPNIPAMFESLNNGEVDAILIDSVVAYYYVSHSEYDFYALPESYVEEKLAIGFRKGDFALRDRVQQLLYDMNDDGTLAKISEKWFGGDITIVR